MKTHLHLIISMVALLAVTNQAQDSQCQSLLRPSSYSYRTDALVNSAVDDNCEEEDIDGIMYTTCNDPNLVLADTLLGPAQFDESDSSSYYHWNKDMMNQVLFTFSSDVSVSRLQLHFYTARDSGIALPKTRLSLVNETFRVSDVLNESTRSFTIDPILGEAGSNHLSNVSKQLTEIFQAMTTQILLRIESDKVYALALSEIKFCSEMNPDTTAVSSAEPSVSSATTVQQLSANTAALPTGSSQSQSTTAVNTTSRTMVISGQVTLRRNIFSITTLLLFVLLVL